ncbi:MAG TPA: LysM peptidoglycan-binding domain-containing protein [Tepidisphaeraceae bacterium]|nr:LysM peptidoglycan-binding domain-containing protein [Tepidisphaeraceae bacterium]
MRKDVRTGAAIGGILIAVVVVYAIVASRGHTDKKKQQAVVDPGKSAATDNSGTPEHLADVDTHEKHIDLTAQLTQPPVADGTAVPAGASIPAHSDVTAPPPSADTDAAAVEHHNKLLAAMNREVPSQPVPERVVVDIPGGGDAAGNGVITAPDHQPGDAANPTTGGPITDGAATGGDPHASTHQPAGDGRPAAPAASKTHSIESGETFSSIARAVYGDAKYYKEIIKANPTVDPTHLKPGMVIVLPEKPQAQPRHDAAPAARTPGTEIADPPLPGTRATEPRAHAAAAPASIDPKTQYRVQSSDSLYKISIKLYHSPNQVDAIYQLNKDQIGTDPAKLKLNMVLKLPAPPAHAAGQ